MFWTICIVIVHIWYILFTGDNWLAIYYLFAKRLSQFGVRKKHFLRCAHPPIFSCVRHWLLHRPALPWDRLRHCGYCLGHRLYYYVTPIVHSLSESASHLWWTCRSCRLRLFRGSHQAPVPLAPCSCRDNYLRDQAGYQIRCLPATPRGSVSAAVGEPGEIWTCRRGSSLIMNRVRSAILNNHLIRTLL
jgi:hypothetical protein